jgi:hypothetical protein
MRRLLLGCLLPALLSGCATSREIVGPNGNPAHAISCGAAVADKCLEKAGELCPHGYRALRITPFPKAEPA